MDCDRIERVVGENFDDLAGSERFRSHPLDPLPTPSPATAQAMMPGRRTRKDARAHGSRSTRPSRRATQVSSPASIGPPMRSCAARSARLPGFAATGEIGGRGEEKAARAFELSRDKARIRQIAYPQREIGALGDQILVPVGHQEVDLEQRMPGEKSRQQRHDAPGAVARRQRDPEHAAQAVGAARRALRVVDRKQRLARLAEQRLAGVVAETCRVVRTRSLTARRPLERRDRSGYGGLRQAEFAGHLREASALDHPHE